MLFYRKGLIFKLIALVLFIGPGTLYAQQTATDFFNISARAMKYRDYSNVVFFCGKALELNPKYAGAYWNRAIAWDFKGENRKAINDYDSALALYDNNSDLSTLHKNRGMVYMNMKKYDSALADFREAISLNPVNVYAWWNKGSAYDAMGQYDSAVNNYTQAMDLSTPGNDKNQLLLVRGKAYRKKGDKAKAEADFKEVLKETETPDYYTANAHYLLGDAKTAQNQIDKYLATASKKPETLKEAYFSAAGNYAQMNRKDEALKYFQLALMNGYNDFVFISRDTDLDLIRNEPAFQEMMKKYKPE